MLKIGCPNITQTLINLKKSNSAKLVPVSRLGKSIVVGRFKHVYVGKKYGVPFLQGKKMPLIRPFDMKYLSRKMTANLQHWIIHPDLVLLTCSVTIGKVCLSTVLMNNWAAHSIS